MSSSVCQSKMQLSSLIVKDSYPLTVHIPCLSGAQLRERFVATLAPVPTHTLLCFLPALVHALSFEPVPSRSALFQFLLARSMADVRIRTSLYWACVVGQEAGKDAAMFARLRDALLITVTSALGVSSAPCLRLRGEGTIGRAPLNDGPDMAWRSVGDDAGRARLLPT